MTEITSQILEDEKNKKNLKLKADAKRNRFNQVSVPRQNQHSDSEDSHGDKGGDREPSYAEERLRLGQSSESDSALEEQEDEVH